MRIIAGKARGTKLNTLEGNNTRPTSDRVKESMFNIIQHNIVDTVFLDLFAGSGAIGLEAISRGAKKAILCDKSKDAVKVINSNIIKTHFEDKVQVYNTDMEKTLTKIEKSKFDYIFIDPPYQDINLIYNAINYIINKDMLNNYGTIIVETDNKEKVLEIAEKIGIEVKDDRKYGRTYLIFLNKKDIMKEG